MNLFYILIICITLDAFLFMMEKGASVRKINLIYCIRHSTIFAGISTLMFLLGKGLGLIVFSKQLVRFHACISVIILLSISLFVFIKALKRKDFIERLDLDFNCKESAKKALITSIDTCLIGVYSIILKNPLFLQMGSVFIITFILIFIAIYIGYTQGALYQKVLSYITATIYFIIACIQLIGIVMR